MAIIDIFNKIEVSCLQNEAISTIGKLNKSCCQNSDIHICDFDKLKDVFYKGTDKPKSCDAIKILRAKEQIDFIEMKSIQDILKWQKPQNKCKLNTHIEKFDFVKKVHDSILIIKEKLISQNEVTDYNTIKKQPILLTDDDENIYTIAFAFDYLGNLSTDIKELMKNEIDKLEPNLMININQPKLKDCKTIINEY